MTHGHDVDRFNRWASSYDRHWMQRIIFDPIQRAVLHLAEEELGRPGTILDVGCGTGRLLRSAAERFPGAKLVGVDAAILLFKQAMRSTPNATIQFQQATAEALPFPESSFDLVLSTMTFHHWQNQARGAAEVKRVLTPNGRWLLAEFVPSGFMKRVRSLLRLHQFLDRGRLDEVLREAGLTAVKERRVLGLGGQVAVMAIGSMRSAGR
jgi:ubiquinone/menaquinone biosynthesis C-methylase UbiE